MNCEFIPPHIAVWAGRAPTLHWGADPPRQGLCWMCWSLEHDARAGFWLQEPKMEQEEAPAHSSLGKGLQSPTPSSPVALHLNTYTLCLQSAKYRLATPNYAQGHCQPHTISTLSPR